MNPRYVWPIAGLLALAVLVVSLTYSPAQRAAVHAPGNGEVGRFEVANASDKQVLILDTTTGRVYKATSKDFERYADLPKAVPAERPERKEKAESKEKDVPQRKDK